jgi:hypothetical protein
MNYIEFMITHELHTTYDNLWVIVNHHELNITYDNLAVEN